MDGRSVGRMDGWCVCCCTRVLLLLLAGWLVGWLHPFCPYHILVSSLLRSSLFQQKCILLATFLLSYLLLFISLSLSFSSSFFLLSSLYAFSSLVSLNILH